MASRKGSAEEYVRQGYDIGDASGLVMGFADYKTAGAAGAADVPVVLTNLDLLAMQAPNSSVAFDGGCPQQA